MTTTSALVLVILPVILGLVAPPCLAANNLLLTSQILLTDQQLSFGEYTFVMQGDCNLVLYNGGFISNTAGRGTNCTLSLDEYGKLIIKGATGSTIWTSPSNSNTAGRYAAVVRPDGAVVVYGPQIWSTAGTTGTPNLKNASRSGLQLLGDTPGLVNNVLFSGEVLSNDARLAVRNSMFVMQGDCNLVLYNGVGGFQSNTAGNGKYCFLRLDHTGLLSILDDSYKSVWSSKTTSEEGEYVLVLDHYFVDTGAAAIYGPAIWSTNSSSAIQKIAMVTED